MSGVCIVRQGGMGTRASGGLAVVDVDDSGDDEFVTDVVDVAAEDVRIFTCPLVCAAAVALVVAPVETSVIGAVFFGLDEDVFIVEFERLFSTSVTVYQISRCLPVWQMLAVERQNY